MSEATHLTLENYTASIGRRLLVRDISLDLKSGEILGLLGPNGAGKSTLMKGLCGLRPAGGRALLGGTDLLTASPAERASLVGYVAQDIAHLDVQLSVLELLLLALNGRRMSWRVGSGSERRARETLAYLGLSHFADRRPGSLSGGERQMVALALALVRRPKLLLLDEPTSALDLANQLHLLGLVADYTRENGIVTMVVLHDLNLATRFASRTLVLKKGVSHRIGPTGETLSPDLLAEVYGVHCCLLPVAGQSYQAIYPLAAIGRPGERGRGHPD